VNTIAERLASVQSTIADAVRSAGRREEDITTIVVTKFHPVSTLRQLHSLGLRDFGENRHQEAAVKASELSDLDIRWNFIGQLQSNKAKSALEYASVIHSLDRLSLVAALERTGRPVDGFIELNLTEDPGRGGVQPVDLPQFAEATLATGTIRILGVMAVAPLGADPRRTFARVREHSETLLRVSPDSRLLSMGMSGDYVEAILEGATHLRIGTAITGNRPARG
jgi:pyridoxal phosphate enzyme (YggS family)